MKPYQWFVWGVLILLAGLFHGVMTSFRIVHYILIAAGTFFIVGAFIVANAKEELDSMPGDLLVSRQAQPVTELSEAKKSRKAKIIFYIILTGILVFAYYYFKEQMLVLAKSHPWLWNLIQHIDRQIDGKTLLGLFYASFFGALFFTPLPVEIIFLYYLTLDYNIYILLAVILIGGVLGEIINYLFGFVLGSGLMKAMMRENFEKWKQKVEKYGGAIVFLASSLPLPLGVIALILGGLRYHLGKFALFVTLGRLVRYIVLILLQNYFLTTVIPFFHSLL